MIRTEKTNGYVNAFSSGYLKLCILCFLHRIDIDFGVFYEWSWMCPYKGRRAYLSVHEQDFTISIRFKNEEYPKDSAFSFGYSHETVVKAALLYIENYIQTKKKRATKCTMQ